MDTFWKTYEMDKQTWNECAEIYEKQIVGGHPDILAFEEFEEDLLDRFLRHLSEIQERSIKVMDIGCGSGRLHARYGVKTHNLKDLPKSHPLVFLRDNSPQLSYDPVIAESLSEVWGIDFSKNMIDLAQKKLKKMGINNFQNINLTFEQGSAFNLKKESDDVLPVAICLVNSIGVMQGQEGANELFSSMRNAVEDARGIAIISCYQKEYIKSYGLGQYESTLDVSGQPIWMQPDSYASSQFKQIPSRYKLAHSNDDTIFVNVFDLNNNLIKKNHALKREPDKTIQTINSGDINTYSNYKSRWYSYNHINELICTHWGKENTYHLKTKDLDILRAEPAQLAILDYGGYLQDLLKQWKVS
jgi:hypothetical protein